MQARLISSVPLAEGVHHFLFEAMGVDRLEFSPGQFVSLKEVIGGKEITRAYSLASAPAEDNHFELCLNRVEGGHLSPHLFAMRPGGLIEMSAPLGTFVMRAPPRDSILIATGTGVAPFRSYLRSYLPRGVPSFTLVFGVRYESHMLYRAELEELDRLYPNFQFWPTLSRPDSGWQGRSGRVQAHLLDAIGGRRDIDFYLCGMKEMVDDVRSILKGMGFDRKQIRYEKYD